MKTLIVGFVIVITVAGCSTMDDVKVSHPCDGPLTVVIAHLQGGGTLSDGSSAYLGKLWTEEAPPNEVSTLAGIVNLGADDLVRVTAHVTGWQSTLTRTEFRDMNGVVTLPPEACP